MRTSRTIPVAVYLAEQRINALVDFERRDGSVAQLASDRRCAAGTPKPCHRLATGRGTTLAAAVAGCGGGLAA